MTSVKKYTVLTAILAGVLLFSQCGSEGSGKRAEKEKINLQNRAESILTSRTMGLAFLEENKLEEAEQEFLKLTSLVPEEAIGYANLGLVYLRMGRYDEAEKNLLKALDLTPLDSDIRLNLATVYKYQNENDKFVEELEKAIEADPGHVQSIYRLAEFYSGTNDETTLLKREKYLKQTLEVSPANIVPRLHLIELLLQIGKPNESFLQLEEVGRIFPEFSDEAKEYYNQAFDAIKANKVDEALTATMIFHNFLKLSNPYNKGITELKGFEGTSVGSPVFTFSETTPLYISEGESILDAIRFTDVTESAGLALFGGSASHSMESEKAAATHIAMGDIDHDGTDDLVDYIHKQKGYNRVAVLRANNRYGRVDVMEFRDAALRVGHPLVLEIRYNDGDTDFEAQLERVRNSNPDVVLLWGNALEMGLILNQMREMGMDYPVFASDRAISPVFLETAGENANGIVATCQYNPDADIPELKAFQINYKERFGLEPDVFAAHAYDGMNITIDAIHRAGLNRALIRDLLTDLKTYQGYQAGGKRGQICRYFADWVKEHAKFPPAKGGWRLQDPHPLKEGHDGHH